MRNEEETKINSHRRHGHHRKKQLEAQFLRAQRLEKSALASGIARPEQCTGTDSDGR